jgi:tRNA(Ile)-lysidine synthase TilS/MesJ
MLFARTEQVPPHPVTLNPAIAVSGGVDSMALCSLVAHHVHLEGWPRQLFAYTIDHGIRPESASEAQLVGDWVRQLGVPTPPFPRPLKAN